MKKNYKIKLICLLCAFTALLSNCKKGETIEEKGLSGKHNKLASGGDGKYDVLGYGYDATIDLLDLASVSDAPIIDVDKFKTDYFSRIDVNSTTGGGTDVYIGYSALDYLKDVSDKKSFDVNGNAKIKGTEEGSNEYNFGASFKNSSTNQTINTFASKYSYATFEAYHRVKTIRFTDDAGLELLNQYLTPEFAYNIANKSAEYLVERYGTHVLLNIGIGGRLIIKYKGIVVTESDYEKKTKATKAGLSFSVLNVFGININAEKSREEITKITTETRDKNYTSRYYGGTNTGQSIAIDKDGNSSESFSIASWQQGINDRNAALIEVGKTAFIYDFISDPVKKQQVKAVVDKRIKDSQIKELGEVPVYVYNSAKEGDHYFTPDNQPTIGGGAFKNEGIAFYGFSKSTDNAVPIYVYYNSRGTDHYFTPDNKPTIGGGGYKNEGIAFYAYASGGANRVPIYVYNSRRGDHYFTPDNKPTIGNGYMYNEGIAFYAPN